MNWHSFFSNPAVVWVLIPIAAILIGGIQQIVKLVCRHQERMAMIHQGFIPPEDDAKMDEWLGDVAAEPNATT
jgi:hypothetical protein